MRVLAQAVHTPLPEHRDDILAAMRRMNAAAAGIDGLEAVGAFDDADAGQLVAITLWSSLEAMQAGMQRLGAVVADVPFDRWETGEPSFTVLAEVAEVAAP